MARVFREPSGNYYALKSDGTKVSLPAGYERNMVLHDTDPNVQQEQGVTAGERFFLKNFDTQGNAGNTDQARKWLEKRGYETRPLNTSGFNFAVRRSGSNGPWKVLDPDTGVFSKDFLSDMTDLTADALMAASAVSTGGIGGAALAGGGAELGRELIGEIGGLEGNISPAQIGLQAGAAAAAPFVGKALKGTAKAIAGSHAGRATGNFLLETGAKIAGVKPISTEAGLLSPGQVLKEFASQAPGKTYKTVRDTAKSLIDMTRKAASTPMGERIRLNHMLNKAGAAGETVDLRSAIKPLTAHLTTPGEEIQQAVTRKAITESSRSAESSVASHASGMSERVGDTVNRLTNKQSEFNTATELTNASSDRAVSRTATSTTESSSTRRTFTARERAQNPKAAHARMRESDLPENAAAHIRKIYETIADATGVPVDKVDLANVPVNVADKVKSNLQYLIDRFNGYQRFGNLDLSRPQLSKALKESAHIMRATISDKMDSWGGPLTISQAGRMVEVPKFSFLYSRLAEKTNELHNFAKAIGAREKGGSLSKAITFIRQTVGDATPEALRNFERQFPHVVRGAEKAVFDANLAEAAAGRGSAGVLGRTARFSAMGQPVGVGIIGGATGIGGYLGGIPGAAAALTGAVGASAAFSPRSIVGATRLAMRGIPSLPKTALAARVAATLALQQAARQASGGSKTVASEASPKRKAYFTGG